MFRQAWRPVSGDPIQEEVLAISQSVCKALGRELPNDSQNGSLHEQSRFALFYQKILSILLVSSFGRKAYDFHRTMGMTHDRF